jgi:hypothetical protein
MSIFPITTTINHTLVGSVQSKLLVNIPDVILSAKTLGEDEQ